MDFESSPEEQRFAAEVEHFLEENHSDQAIDANPEQLSQTVDSPPERAFMPKLAERGWLGGWTPSAHFADGYWVGARTDPEAERDGMRDPGLEISATRTTARTTCSSATFVPDNSGVGEGNRGWTYICEALDLERFGRLLAVRIPLNLQGNQTFNLLYATYRILSKPSS